MDVGAVMPRDLAGSTADMTRFAGAAEELGYGSLWVTEHIVVPVEISSRYPYSADGRPTFSVETPYPEAMVTLGCLAGVTRRLRLGTAVIPLCSRDPLVLATQAATGDQLSGGRLELGVGAGWLEEEAHALGHPSDHRGGRLDEAIEIMRKSWSERTFDYNGRYYRLPNIGMHPHPPQGARLPVWIGGGTPRAIRTAAERAEGLLVWLTDPDQLAEFSGRLRELNPAVRLGTSLRTAGDPAAVADRAQKLRAAGADLLLAMPSGDMDGVLAQLQAFSEVAAER